MEKTAGALQLCVLLKASAQPPRLSIELGSKPHCHFHGPYANGFHLQQRTDLQQFDYRKPADAAAALWPGRLKYFHVPVIPLGFLALIALGLEQLTDALPLLGEVVLHRDAMKLVAAPVDPLQNR